MGNDQHMDKQGHGVCDWLYQKVKGWRYEKLQPVWNHCFIQLHTYTLTYTCIKYIPAYVCMYTDTHNYDCTCLSVIKNVLTKLNNLCDWALFNPVIAWFSLDLSEFYFSFQPCLFYPFSFPFRACSWLISTNYADAWVNEMLRYDSQRKTSSTTNVIKGQSVKNLKN